MTIKRYTLSITGPIESVGMHEDDNGAFVEYKDVMDLARRFMAVRILLGAALVSDAESMRNRVGDALSNLERP
jgi:hypothetical protein